MLQEAFEGQVLNDMWHALSSNRIYKKILYSD